MKITHVIGLGIILFLIASCTTEIGKTTVTYIKATPVYKTPSEVRNQPLNTSEGVIENIGKVFVGEDYLLIGDENTGIHVIDNSDPNNPSEINFLNIPGNYDFYVEGNTLFANNYFDLVKLDMQNMSSAQIVSRNTSALIKEESIKFGPGNEETILVGFEFERVTEEVDHDTRIWDFISEGQSTIYFDYADQVIPPSSIPVSFVGNSSGSRGTTNRLAVKNDQLYILTNGGIDQYNSGLEEVGSYNIWEPGLETIFERNNHIYVGSQQAMTVFKVNDQNLELKGNFRHQASCDPVLPISEDIAYVTTRSGGQCPGEDNVLYVVDTDLESGSFVEAQRISMSNPFGMALIGNLLFVAEGEFGLTVLDATDHDNLRIIKRHRDLTVYDVLAHPSDPDILFIANDDSIEQYQISNQGIDKTLLSRIVL
jgi:hypothetical protein